MLRCLGRRRKRSGRASVQRADPVAAASTGTNVFDTIRDGGDRGGPGLFFGERRDKDSDGPSRLPLATSSDRWRARGPVPLRRCRLAVRLVARDADHAGAGLTLVGSLAETGRDSQGFPSKKPSGNRSLPTSAHRSGCGRMWRASRIGHDASIRGRRDRPHVGAATGSIAPHRPASFIRVPRCRPFRPPKHPIQRRIARRDIGAAG